MFNQLAGFLAVMREADDCGHGVAARARVKDGMEMRP
jgi:hypothetical protein